MSVSPLGTYELKQNKSRASDIRPQDVHNALTEEQLAIYSQVAGSLKGTQQRILDGINQVLKGGVSLRSLSDEHFSNFLNNLVNGTPAYLSLLEAQQTGCSFNESEYSEYDCRELLKILDQNKLNSLQFRLLLEIKHVSLPKLRTIVESFFKENFEGLDENQSRAFFGQIKANSSIRDLYVEFYLINYPEHTEKINQFIFMLRSISKKDRFQDLVNYLSDKVPFSKALLRALVPEASDLIKTKQEIECEYSLSIFQKGFSCNLDQLISFFEKLSEGISPYRAFLLAKYPDSFLDEYSEKTCEELLQITNMNKLCLDQILVFLDLDPSLDKGNDLRNELTRFTKDQLGSLSRDSESEVFFRNFLDGKNGYAAFCLAKYPDHTEKINQFIGNLEKLNFPQFKKLLDFLSGESSFCLALLQTLWSDLYFPRGGSERAFEYLLLIANHGISLRNANLSLFFKNFIGKDVYKAFLSSQFSTLNFENLPEEFCQKFLKEMSSNNFTQTQLEWFLIYLLENSNYRNFHELIPNLEKAANHKDYLQYLNREEFIDCLTDHQDRNHLSQLTELKDSSNDLYQKLLNLVKAKKFCGCSQVKLLVEFIYQRQISPEVTQKILTEIENTDKKFFSILEKAEFINLLNNYLDEIFGYKALFLAIFPHFDKNKFSDETCKKCLEIYNYSYYANFNDHESMQISFNELLEKLDDEDFSNLTIEDINNNIWFFKNSAIDVEFFSFLLSFLKGDSPFRQFLLDSLGLLNNSRFTEEVCKKILNLNVDNQSRAALIKHLEQNPSLDYLQYINQIREEIEENERSVQEIILLDAIFQEESQELTEFITDQIIKLNVGQQQEVYNLLSQGSNWHQAILQVTTRSGEESKSFGLNRSMALMSGLPYAVVADEHFELVPQRMLTLGHLIHFDEDCLNRFLENLDTGTLGAYRSLFVANWPECKDEIDFELNYENIINAYNLCIKEGWLPVNTYPLRAIVFSQYKNMRFDSLLESFSNEICKIIVKYNIYLPGIVYNGVDLSNAFKNICNRLYLQKYGISIDGLNEEDYRCLLEIHEFLVTSFTYLNWRQVYLGSSSGMTFIFTLVSQMIKAEGLHVISETEESLQEIWQRLKNGQSLKDAITSLKPAVLDSSDKN